MSSFDYPEPCDVVARIVRSKSALTEFRECVRACIDATTVACRAVVRDAEDIEPCLDRAKEMWHDVHFASRKWILHFFPRTFHNADDDTEVTTALTVEFDRIFDRALKLPADRVSRSAFSAGYWLAADIRDAWRKCPVTISSTDWPSGKDGGLRFIRELSEDGRWEDRLRELRKMLDDEIDTLTQKASVQSSLENVACDAAGDLITRYAQSRGPGTRVELKGVLPNGIMVYAVDPPLPDRGADDKSIAETATHFPASPEERNTALVNLMLMPDGSDLTLERAAAQLGCSTATVQKCPAWKPFAARKRTIKRRVTAGSDIIHQLADERTEDPANIMTRREPSRERSRQ